MKDELKNIIIEELENTVAQTKRCNPSVEYYRTGRFTTSVYSFEDIANNIISKLPEQIITEDRIVEVLNSFHAIINPKYSYKQIAHEILQTQGWESIGEVKITEANIDNVGYWFKEYKGKNIEIAIREVK